MSTTDAAADATRAGRRRSRSTTRRCATASQLEGISLTVDDKLRIAEQLDWLGVHFIEGGWPGANPKDDEFFRRAPTELQLDDVARWWRSGRPGGSKGKVDDDDTLRHLRRGRHVGTVCIVGKCVGLPRASRRCGTTLDEGVAMVGRLGRVPARRTACEVLFDAEHFFDGYKRNPEFALRVLEAAATDGRRAASCCATPTAARCRTRSSAIVARGRRLLRRRRRRSACTSTTTPACGVANALAGVRGGATQVQGTINGYGERTGNCNLTTIIPNLTLKMGIETIPPDRLERLTPVAHHVAELVNMPLNPQAAVRRARRRSPTRPGCTSSAIAQRPDAYEHVAPDSVGNGTRFVVSRAGRASRRSS